MEANGVVDAYQEFATTNKKLEAGKEDIVEAAEDAHITDPDWPYDRSPAQITSMNICSRLVEKHHAIC